MLLKQWDIFWDCDTPGTWPLFHVSRYALPMSVPFQGHHKYYQPRRPESSLGMCGLERRSWSRSARMVHPKQESISSTKERQYMTELLFTQNTCQVRNLSPFHRETSFFVWYGIITPARLSVLPIGPFDSVVLFCLTLKSINEKSACLETYCTW
jgi:hypothetical protein